MLTRVVKECNIFGGQVSLLRSTSKRGTWIGKCDISVKITNHNNLAVQLSIHDNYRKKIQIPCLRPVIGNHESHLLRIYEIC